VRFDLVLVRPCAVRGDVGEVVLAEFSGGIVFELDYVMRGDVDLGESCSAEESDCAG